MRGNKEMHGLEIQNKTKNRDNKQRKITSLKERGESSDGQELKEFMLYIQKSMHDCQKTIQGLQWETQGTNYTLVEWQ